MVEIEETIYFLIRSALYVNPDLTYGRDGAGEVRLVGRISY